LAKMYEARVLANCDLSVLNALLSLPHSPLWGSKSDWPQTD
jgi:hypothetical protein